LPPSGSARMRVAAISSAPSTRVHNDRLAACGASSC
jgi:hypothetical protein